MVGKRARRRRSKKKKIISQILSFIYKDKIMKEKADHVVVKRLFRLPRPQPSLLERERYIMQGLALGRL